MGIVPYKMKTVICSKILKLLSVRHRPLPAEDKTLLQNPCFLLPKNEKILILGSEMLKKKKPSGKILDGFVL